MSTETKCNLCKKTLDVYRFELGKWTFHLECYQIVMARLEPFADALFASEDEWQKWLNEKESVLV